MNVEAKRINEDEVPAKALRSSFLTKLIYNHFYLLVALVIAVGGVRELWLFAAMLVVAFLVDIWRRKVLENNSEMLRECLLNRDDTRVKRQHLFFTIVLVGLLVVYPVSILLFKSWYPEDMNAYFSFFQPVYDVLGHVVPVIRSYPVQLVENGFAHRVPLIIHLYSWFFVNVILILLSLILTSVVNNFIYFLKGSTKRIIWEAKKYIYWIALPLVSYVVLFCVKGIGFNSILGINSWRIHNQDYPFIIMILVSVVIIDFTAWSYYFACLIETKPQEKFQIKEKNHDR